MESSGNNRYELLFMDDDGGSAPAPAPAPAEVQTKKKQSTSATAAPVKKAQTTSTTANKKPNPNTEKENKAGTLNKNESAGGKRVNAVSGGGQVPKGKQSQNPNQSQLNGGTSSGGNIKKRPTDGFRPQQSGGVTVGAPSGGEQRNVRRNFKEGGGEFGGNDQQRPPRQYRDNQRENRGPPRNRFGENGYRKREFDRQSGSDKTGVKAVDKRDGAGAHNWGSVKQEIDDVNKSTNEGDTTLTDKEESSNEQTGDQVAVPEEDETKEMTLDEWKAMQQQRNKPQYNLRKAGEGEDTSQWKKMTVLNKKKEGDSEEEFEYDPSLYPQRVGRLQRIVDIQFNFNDSRRGGGSGFGRGRGRGGGGRPGGGRFNDAGGRGSAPGENKYIPSGKPRNFGDNKRGGGPNSLKVDDERQFPTLS